MTRIRTAIAIALCLTALRPASANPLVIFADPSGDATPRRTDVNADGPFDPQTQTTPDLLSIELSDFAPIAPHIDPFTGAVDENGGFVRIDLVFDGLVNPPGEVNIGGGYYDPTAYGPNPIFGYIEFDIDGNENTGGEVEYPDYRYLGNAGRFGGLSSEARFYDRCALVHEDCDSDLLTHPYVERSGEEFHLALIDDDLDGIQVIVANPNGLPGTFDAGEVWQARSEMFHRAHVYDEFTVMCQSGNDRYEPEHPIQFAHDIATDRTTISLMIPKTNADAAKLWSPTRTPQSNDGCDDNQYSITEAVTDMIVSATVASPFTRMRPEFPLIAEWEFQSAADALDITQWHVSALIGTAYLPQRVDGAEFIWFDVFPNILPGDVNGDGVVDAADQADIDEFITAFDGDPMIDADGDPMNGSIQWINFGTSFTVFDVNYDGFIDGNELSAGLVGDMNLDGAIDGHDIAAFVLALLDRPAYEVQYPAANADAIGDVNDDGACDENDIAGFVLLLTAD